MSAVYALLELKKKWMLGKYTCTYVRKYEMKPNLLYRMSKSLSLLQVFYSLWGGQYVPRHYPLCLELGTRQQPVLWW